jgi:4-hydroxy-tetrahydrodipicolinate reductase
VAVAGAGGRLGSSLVGAFLADPRFALTGALVRPGSGRAGKPVPGAPGDLHYREALASGARIAVLVEASRADAVAARAAEAVRREAALLVAVTGLGAEARAALDEAARRVAVLEAPNLSLGALVLVEVVRLAARRLAEWGVEIVETHHAAKRDRPSGTALWLARQVASARPARAAEPATSAAPGGCSSAPGEVAIHSLRVGTAPGEHRVRLGGPGEHLEFVHVVETREAFARGALGATAWLATAPAGRYTMEDILDAL